MQRSLELKVEKLEDALPSSLPKEEDGKDVQHETSSFENWGKTIQGQPSDTFFPKTLSGLQNIVMWANDRKKNVRTTAYMHTWSHFYPVDQQVRISLLSKEELKIPERHKAIDQSNQFQKIELVGQAFKDNDGQTKHLAKIWAATTNEQFRVWCNKSFVKNGSENTWTMPFNVVLVGNTFGGTFLNMCHGAGWKHPTLADLATEIHFINPKGEQQSVGYKITDSPDLQKKGQALIKSAVGSFGIPGIVTSLTVKLDRLTHARMIPTKKRLALTIPPPDDFKIPKDVPPHIMSGVTKEQLRQAKIEFIKRCEEHYYSEWFWFPLHSKCWINTWQNDGDAKKSKPYPSEAEVSFQAIQLYLAGVANRTLLKWLPSTLSAELLSDAAMLSLPADKEITTTLVDALHFQRGIRNQPVQNLEFEIPIPELSDGSPDWGICQKAWWFAVIALYEWLEKTGNVSMRLPLEMRIMGPSMMTMAPQYGNHLGTCSIEILTVEAGLVDDWHEFMQYLTDKWASITDYKGNPLNIRPHWAKQWEGLTIQRPGEVRQDILDYLKKVTYKEAIPVFKQHLEEIAEQGGYPADRMQMFSNPLLDHLIYDGQKPEIKKGVRVDEPEKKPKEEELEKNLIDLINQAKRAHKEKRAYLKNRLQNPKNEVKIEPIKLKKPFSATRDILFSQATAEIKKQSTKTQALEEQVRTKNQTNLLDDETRSVCMGCNLG